VTTRSALSSAVTAPGTYLNREELRRVGFRETVTPKLRRYGFQDTLRKVFSPAGAILLLITVLGVLGAALSFWIAVVGESPTSAREVSERSQTLVTWVTAPADRLEGADSPKVALGRRFIRRREATAERCLRSLGGGEPSGESPGGVSCVPKDVPWWKDKEAASGVGLLIGLAVTLLGGLGVRQRFGFGGRP